jgi:hypothetical protein
MNNLVCQTISHDLDINKRKEVADCEALEFDLYFQQKYPQSERVDYIEIIENGLILIELKDLESKIKNLYKNNTTTQDIKNEINNNLDKKYKESIKISRNEIQSNLIDIVFYIVVKNDTDIVFLNNFLNIQQIKNNFHLYKTRSICKKLSIFNTRLCQE